MWRWRLALSGALLLWVLGGAYHRARRRGRDLGLVVLFVGGGIILFGAAALVPRPPMTLPVSNVLVVGSVVLLGLAMGVLLWRGFRE